MLESWREQWRLGLSPRGLGLLRSVRRHAWTSHSVHPASGPDWDVQSVMAKWESLRPESVPNGAKLRVVVADQWCRAWLVTPPTNALGLEDCRSAAVARFEALYSEPIDGWTLSADWHASDPFIAMAIPKQLMQELQESCERGQIQLQEMLPHSIAVWNGQCQHLQAGDWLAVMHHHTLTLLNAQSEQRTAMRSLALGRESFESASGLTALLSREAMRSGWSAPPRVHLAGDIPAAWWEDQAGAPRIVAVDRGLMPAGIDSAAPDAISIAQLAAAGALA